MRAVVIAVKDRQAAVAGKGGALAYIENHGYEIGQMLEISPESFGLREPQTGEMGEAVQKGEQIKVRSDSGRGTLVHFPAGKSTRRFHPFASAAAALLAVAVTGTVAVNAAPVSTVTLDVNPSVSYELNLFDRVVRAKALNDDGEELLDGLSGRVMWKPLTTAVEETLTELRDNAYITGEDTPAAVTVSDHIRMGDRRDDRLIRELEDSAATWNGGQEGLSVTMDARKVTRELREEARERGMTPGRMMLEEMHRERGEAIPGAPADRKHSDPGATDDGNREEVPQEKSSEGGVKDDPEGETAGEPSDMQGEPPDVSERQDRAPEKGSREQQGRTDALNREGNRPEKLPSGQKDAFTEQTEQPPGQQESADGTGDRASESGRSPSGQQKDPQQKDHRNDQRQPGTERGDQPGTDPEGLSGNPSDGNTQPETPPDGQRQPEMPPDRQGQSEAPRDRSGQPEGPAEGSEQPAIEPGTDPDGNPNGQGQPETRPGGEPADHPGGMEPSLSQPEEPPSSSPGGRAPGQNGQTPGQPPAGGH